jgi:hypothetical protein
MKCIALFCLALLFFGVSSTAQISFSQAPSVYSNINHQVRTGIGARGPDTLNLTEPLLTEFESRIQRARKTNAIGIGMGCAANLSLVVNGGFLNPDDDIESYQPVFALIGLGTGVARLIISLNTIRQLNCARDALLQYVSQPGYDSLFSSTLLRFRSAKNLSVAIPGRGSIAGTRRQPRRSGDVFEVLRGGLKSSEVANKRCSEVMK